MATKRKVTETVKAEDQPEAETAGASAGGGRGGTQRSRKAKAEPSGKLNGSIWEAGRGYNPGDELEFEKLNLSTEKLQFLANQVVMTKDGAKPLIEGFGVEPNEDAEEMPEVTGAGSPGRRAGAREEMDDEDEEEE